MQFLLLAHDGADSEAPGRRLAARPAHLALGAELKASGNLLYAAAILDAEGAMVGSMQVLDFPDEAAVESYLAIEPYATDGVWKSIDVKPCRPAPAFTANV